MNNVKLSPLYPSAVYKTKKDRHNLQALAAYCIANASKANGVIVGAELDTQTRTRVTWAELYATGTAQAAAQGVKNFVCVYENRAGGPTYTGGGLEEAAEAIWELSQRARVEADPYKTFQELQRLTSELTGTLLYALEMDGTKYDLK